MADNFWSRDTSRYTYTTYTSSTHFKSTYTSLSPFWHEFTTLLPCTWRMKTKSWNYFWNFTRPKIAGLVSHMKFTGNWYWTSNISMHATFGTWKIDSNRCQCVLSIIDSQRTKQMNNANCVMDIVSRIEVRIPNSTPVHSMEYRAIGAFK